MRAPCRRRARLLRAERGWNYAESSRSSRPNYGVQFNSIRESATKLRLVVHSCAFASCVHPHGCPRSRTFLHSAGGSALATGPRMSATQSAAPFDDLSQRWHALAERRLAHFTELHRSGRWRLYYPTEQQFAARMLEVIRAAKVWSELAGCRLPPVAAPKASTVPAAPDVQPTPAPVLPPSRAELVAVPKPHRVRSAA